MVHFCILRNWFMETILVAKVLDDHKVPRHTSYTSTQRESQMKQILTLSHDTWMSLSLQQQAEQRAKYDVTVSPAYAQADEVAEVAKEGK